MLPLDSPEWGKVEHAYGPASDLPPLLRQLTADPTPKEKSARDPWEFLWSALCHQGDVYQASYVAVPHIVEIASKASGPVDSSFFLLPALIEVARGEWARTRNTTPVRRCLPCSPAKSSRLHGSPDP